MYCGIVDLSLIARGISRIRLNVFSFFFFFFVKVKRIVIQIIVIFVKSEMIHGEDNRERQESLKLKSGFRNRYL